MLRVRGGRERNRTTATTDPELKSSKTYFHFHSWHNTDEHDYALQNSLDTTQPHKRTHNTRRGPDPTAIQSDPDLGRCVCLGGCLGILFLYPALFKDQTHYIVDRSEELQVRCPIECTKQVWSTEPVQDIGLDEKEFTYFRKVTIITIRSCDEDGAQNTAENLFDEFSPYYKEIIGQEEYDPFFNRVTAPLENTRFGRADDLYKLPGYHLILTTSKGLIALLVISYTPPWVDDFTTELELAAEFANVQLYQLERAGILP